MHLSLLLILLPFASLPAQEPISFPHVHEVKVSDPMWTPLMDRAKSITVPDVLDKFEGKRHTTQEGGDNNWSPDKGKSDTAVRETQKDAFRNFDLVAQGHVGDGHHVGFPWFDGLIYESITGISDLLLHYPDKALEERIDAYIDRIAAAQDADRTGWLNTYTTLEENDHRWGEHGGNLRWQHDVYNDGCLVEAGVHYYRATGKTKLLEVALRNANYMYDFMVAAGRNIVPGHALPEDALIQLWQLCQDEPKLGAKLHTPVYPDHYRTLAAYWLEQRGHVEGRSPLQQYAQDDKPFSEMTTIEGHAVRATLHATGLADMALAGGDKRYAETAKRLWDNMVGCRMFITGGVGAIHEDEKFGPDYYLPSDAYLETCAAIGAGLFSWRMNALTGEARYVDVLERILFNSVPAAVSLSGEQYTYQNPLNADRMNRWAWHDCPCCPPMWLKMLGQLPAMIYGTSRQTLYVNLFVGSEATLDVPGTGKVHVKQTVDWQQGEIRLNAMPLRRGAKLTVKVRIPSWCGGAELPTGLYRSNLSGQDDTGYRTFPLGESSLRLDLSPRVVTADSRVRQLSGLGSLASGPFVYALERIDNEASWDELSLLHKDFELKASNTPFPGIPCIVSTDHKLTAIPFWLVGNRCHDTAYRVWVNQREDTLSVHPDKVVGPITPYLYGTGMEDVNHEIYGGLYSQLIFGESFEEGGPAGTGVKGFRMYDTRWLHQGGEVYVRNAKTAKLLYDPMEKVRAAEVDVIYDELQCGGNAAGLMLSVSDCHDGADAFRGYEISLHGSGRHIVVGRHDHNFQLLKNLPVQYDASRWHRLQAEVEGGTLRVSLDGKPVGEVTDPHPLPAGRAGLRSYEVNASWRDFAIASVDGTTTHVPFLSPEGADEVSSMWMPLTYGDPSARYWLTHDNVRHGAQAQCLSSSGVGRAGVRNMGLNRWGISLHKGHKLEGHVYLRTQTKTQTKTQTQTKTKVYVALLNADGTRHYARQELGRVTSRWQRFDFQLTPDSDDPCASFAIYIEGAGSLAIDQVELMPQASDRFQGQPIRADLAQLFAQQGITFMRYGGSMVNSAEYTYAAMRDERAQRPPYRGFWYRQSTNGFGIREFVDFAEAEGCALSFAINIEETPETAAQLVRDLRGRVKYIEIGNEEILIPSDRGDLYDHYVERFLLLRQAMLDVDPTLQFICSAWWRPGSPDVERTFRALDGKADFWDFHPWVDDYPSAQKVEASLRSMQQLFHQWNPATKMRCAILEENGDSHGVRRALCHAIVQNAVRRMGDFVLCTCPANALEPYRQNDNGWNQGQIFFTPDQSWGMPPYYVQQMSALHHMPLLIESNLAQANPMLDVTATCNESRTSTVLHIVNIASSAQSLRLDGLEGLATITTLSGDEAAENTPEQPLRISPRTTNQSVSEPLLLRPHSYTVVRIDK